MPRSAGRIAEALHDDVELYRAWVHAGPYPDLRAQLSRLTRLERAGSTPDLYRKLQSGEEVDAEEPAEPVGGPPRVLCPATK